jgi:hypothetical protein
MKILLSGNAFFGLKMESEDREDCYYSTAQKWAAPPSSLIKTIKRQCFRVLSATRKYYWIKR